MASSTTFTSVTPTCSNSVAKPSPTKKSGLSPASAPKGMLFKEKVAIILSRSHHQLRKIKVRNGETVQVCR